jgi:hypothetical protein
MLKKQITVLLTFMFLISYSNFSLAEDVDDEEDTVDFEPEFKKKIKFSGNFFGNMGVDFSRRELVDGSKDDIKLGFNVTRMYLTAKTELLPWLKTRTTLDFAYFLGDLNSAAENVGESGGKDPLGGFIKYAFFDAKLNKNMTLRFGQQGTAWTSYIHKIWGYRMISDNAAANAGWQSTARTGISLLGSFFDKRVTGSISVYNHDTYKYKPDADQEMKELQYEAFITLKPFADNEEHLLYGLELSGYASTIGDSSVDASGLELNTIRTNSFGGILAYSHKYFTVMVETMFRKSDEEDFKTEQLVAPYLILKYKKFQFIVNYSYVQNPNNKEEEVWSRFLTGFAWKQKEFAVSLNYQQIDNKKHAAGDSADSKGIFINTMFKF